MKGNENLVTAVSSRGASCFEADFFRHIKLFQAPQLTTAHKLIGVAACLGFLFAVLHPVTILVTIMSDGADWGAAAWSTDLTGYFAGVGFAFLCRNASNARSVESQPDTSWIVIWAGITFFVRVLDILMLTGVVKIDAIYHTPTGPTLYANVVSEIVVAFSYTVVALAGSAYLTYFPEDELSDGTASSLTAPALRP